MKDFFRSQKYFFLLTAIYFVSLLIVNPTGEFPLNDDWSYTKSVLILQNEGRIDIGIWPAMTLASHLVWGFIFIKIFGFSFFVLRISTWVSVLIGIWVLNNLLARVSKDRLIAFAGTSLLLFNPIYFNLSNTFMTDVNFLTLIILCFHFAYDFFKTGKLSSFILVYFLSLILILLRQYGIIMPVCMTFTCLFLSHRKFFFVILGAVFTAGVYIVFEMYEDYLKSFLPTYASYKYSGYINPLKEGFWGLLQKGFITRYKSIIIQVSFYIFPILVAFLPSVFKRSKYLLFCVIAVIVVIGIHQLHGFNTMQQGNIFGDTALGPDTTYETLLGKYKNDMPHFYSKGFDYFLIVLTYLFVTISITMLVYIVGDYLTQNFRTLRLNLFVIFLMCLALSYILMVMITESYFDRYQLPLILIGIVFVVSLQRFYEPRLLWSILPMLLFFYFAVGGTHDYFAWNKHKWEAYHYLRTEKQIPHEKINGGFEVICWSEGRSSDWYGFDQLHKVDYLIQFNSTDSFAVMKDYPFQRYLPFRKDTLTLYERTIHANGGH